MSVKNFKENRHKNANSDRLFLFAGCNISINEIVDFA